MIKGVKEDFFESMNVKLRDTSKLAFNKLSGIRGIEPMKAQAALYMMVKIKFEEFKDIKDDMEFC